MWAMSPLCFCFIESINLLIAGLGGAKRPTTSLPVPLHLCPTGQVSSTRALWFLMIFSWFQDFFFFTNLAVPHNFLERREVATKERKK